ncbi:hypothetical protein [Fortiea contorta]|uniref:hypothetical protein n=1 Tax=Fortiea contorta TaxID=1892405 RepID=UPI001EE643BB|nr:hypothetical protein [Fortiea contorta]
MKSAIALILLIAKLLDPYSTQTVITKPLVGCVTLTLTHPTRLAIAFLEQPIQIWDVQIGETVQTLSRHFPYEGIDITGVTGISEGQKMSLKALGAIQV